MRPRFSFAICLLGLAPALLRAAPGPAPSMDPRDDRVQRKAIRGGAVDLSRESAELRELREFEQATFPRAGMRPAAPAETPGLSDEPKAEPQGSLGSGLGPDAVPEPLRTPEPRRPSGEPGTRLPTIPWLSALKLLDNLGLSATFV